MPRSLIRKVITAWQDWRFDKKMARRCPEYAERRAELRKAASAHRPTRGLRKAVTDALHAELRREVGL